MVSGLLSGLRSLKTLSSKRNVKIAVIGLGYVGLPLAVELAKRFPVIGYDISMDRVEALQSGYDSTLEIDGKDLQSARDLEVTNDPEMLAEANFYIVTVPTPIDQFKRPDLAPLTNASTTVAKYLSKGNIVVYESTVFPGATEEICVPILEQVSGLKYVRDFSVGYSPERINPGDKSRGLTSIVKVTSGSSNHAADAIDDVYKAVIKAGIYRAPSIKVAEAAKVIENTQRDINIALMNELSKLFKLLDIDTEEVLRAAETKWNFLPFRPGLVGGHCIGVDPYYLTHKAEEVGYHSEIIKAGRRLNDGMGAYCAQLMLKKMISLEINPGRSRVLVLGGTFKEDCPDVRNTRVVDIVKELQSFGVAVTIFDPWLQDDIDPAKEFCCERIMDLGQAGMFDGVIVAVAHSIFKELGASEIRSLCHSKSVLFDLKSIFQASDSDLRL